MSIEDTSLLLIKERLRGGAAVIEMLLRDNSYLETVIAATASMSTALHSDHKVLFFGNGGSAADAQHLAAELSGRYLRERPSLPGLALTTNGSTLTAIGNDYSFESIFARQIEGLGTAGDVAFGISTSGNSMNVIHAMEVARRRKLITIALTGRDGGKIRATVDHCMCIPTLHTPRIQEAHILTGHIICELLERSLFG